MNSGNLAGNKNQFVTGFFGKLPVYADFIKHNTANKEIQIFDNWIQEGLALAKIKYKDDWKSYYQNCPRLNFVYPFTGTENLMIGLLVNSSDKSGRSYPFIIFTIIGKNLLRELPSYLLPLTFNQLLNSFREFFNLYSTCEDIALLRSTLNELRMNIPDTLSLSVSYKKFTAERSISELINSGGTDLPLLTGFLNKRINISDNLVAADFPLKSDLQINSYCIQMIQKIFKNESCPGIFWTDQESSSMRLFLLFTKAKPANLAELIYLNKILSSGTEFVNQTANIFREDLPLNENLKLNDFISSLTNYLN